MAGVLMGPRDANVTRNFQAAPARAARQPVRRGLPAYRRNAQSDLRSTCKERSEQEGRRPHPANRDTQILRASLFGWLSSAKWAPAALYFLKYLAVVTSYIIAAGTWGSEQP